MANIIIPGGHDTFGKTRSEQEENMRKEWGSTITDSQLDKLKHMERKEKERSGSAKNFVAADKIDEYDDTDSVGRRDSFGRIFSSGYSKQGRETFDRIFKK